MLHEPEYFDRIFARMTRDDMEKKESEKKKPTCGCGIYNEEQPKNHVVGHCSGCLVDSIRKTEGQIDQEHSQLS